MLQDTTSRVPARGEICNLISLDPDTPSGFGGAFCGRKSWKEAAGTQDDPTFAPLKMRSIMNSVQTTARQPSDEWSSEGAAPSSRSKPRV